MKALLLAAGFGNRLKPITDYVPKCLVPINGKPLLAYWLENLVAAGAQGILINLHYKADQVQAFVDHSPYKTIIKTVYEEELLLTGGTLHKNRDFFGGDDVLMAHADNLCICDFKSFVRSYYERPKNVDMTMMTFKTDNPTSCGVVELDDNNIVVGFYEKVKSPPSHLASGAVYIISSNVLKFLAGLKKEKIDFSTEVIPRFIGHINTFHNDVYHRDIGTLESYALAQIEARGLHE
ncbi:MAG: mannose-1-phosphate guanylyltransferase [Gammaproteobacteria bacterium RIFCSPHIGHO2_02_FULL_42_13]|nr:MAG: mannose-1-phosphate guanylyltransferase [Gammaproteobacteria bacterium RIFCSPHIGHO2_02_FULL_42_13]OGT71006.1 MAG: mannose-1-phosphate guanylyltransferase [Gammaproteobacteria bacterium RIFCSPLOWO2_02_FULL_42_9]